LMATSLIWSLLAADSAEPANSSREQSCPAVEHNFSALDPVPF
jgi:hypothetical protein